MGSVFDTDYPERDVAGCFAKAQRLGQKYYFLPSGRTNWANKTNLVGVVGDEFFEGAVLCFWIGVLVF